MPNFSVTNDLNWDVSHRPMFYTGNDGEPVQYPNRVAVVRDDNGKCLGAVSPDYETVQNKDLLALIQPMVDEQVLTIENMGFLHSGSLVFAQAKIHETYKVIGEEYNAYITLLNGHVGNASVKIGVTAHRVICGNSFTLAYKDISHTFQHRAGVNERILETPAVKDYVETMMGKYREKVETLENRECPESEFRDIVSKVYRKDYDKIRHAETLNRLFYSGAGNVGKTYYDAFNAITDYASNSSRRTEEGRLIYANFGSGNGYNLRAMEVLLKRAV